MPARYRTLLRMPLIVCGLALPAIAQTTPGLTNYPECIGKPSASDSEAAHSAFLLGKRFFDEADYGSAIHNFVDAYKLDCTKAELLTIIARANELSGNKAEAVHALETYLVRAPNVAPEDKTQIQKRIDNLKALIVAQTPPPASAAPVPIAPPVATVPSPPPPPSAPPPTPVEGKGGHTAAPWVVTISGGAVLVTGGAIWLVGHGKYSDATAACPGNKGCTISVTNEGNTGRTLMLA